MGDWLWIIFAEEDDDDDEEAIDEEGDDDDCMLLFEYEDDGACGGGTRLLQDGDEADHIIVEAEALTWSSWDVGGWCDVTEFGEFKLWPNRLAAATIAAAE